MNVTDYEGVSQKGCPLVPSGNLLEGVCETPSFLLVLLENG